MIEFKIGDDRVSKIAIKGRLEDIILESEMFVNAVYTSLLVKDKEAADTFKDVFPVVVNISENIFSKSKIISGSAVEIGIPRNGDCKNGNP